MQSNSINRMQEIIDGFFKARTTFKSTKGLLRELKHYAADNDITVTDILNQACKDFLSRKAKKWTGNLDNKYSGTGTNQNQNQKRINSW